MRFTVLFAIVLALAMLVVTGCASTMERLGYEPAHEHAPPAPPARRYYAEEVKQPGAFANFEPRAADGSGIVRINLAHCKVGTTDDEILSYNCVKPEPEPAAKVE